MIGKLNKYIHITPCNGEYLLYNTINESIVALREDRLRGRNVILDEGEHSQLKSLNFFEPDDCFLANLIEKRSGKQDTLIITISMTQACNLCCVYCSQNDSKDKGVISENDLDETVKYILECHKRCHFKTIAVDFFGGEPLLGQSEILYFKRQIEKYISPQIISYAIDTNGVLLSKDFFEKFNQLYINLTLSDKRDHDTKRIFQNGAGSFDIILKNLLDCADLFNDNRQLRIRNNVSRDTMNSFPDFVHFVKKYLPWVQYMEIVPIVDFSYNPYRARIAFKDFSDWYINSAIDVLLENNIFVHFPSPIYSHCRAYAPYDLKVMPDGSLTVCSGQKYGSRSSHISEVSSNIDKVKRIFEVKRTPPIDEECMNCPNIFLCGGKQFCKVGNPCDHLQYNLDDFLKKYYSYIGTEKESLFSTLSNLMAGENNESC